MASWFLGQTEELNQAELWLRSWRVAKKWINTEMRINWTKPKAFQNHIYKSGIFCLSPECDGWSRRRWWNGMHHLVSSPWTLPWTGLWATRSPVQLQHNSSSALQPPSLTSACVLCCQVKNALSRVIAPEWPPESPGCDLLYKHVIISHMRWNTRPRGCSSWN